MEALICSTTKAMKEMMALVKAEKSTGNDDKSSNDEKKKKREEKRKRYNEAPTCKHCNKKHPSKAEDECWELEKDAAARPANWMSNKST